MAGEVSDAVKKCCDLLKNSPGDNEKFAALFMVTKLVKGKHATPAARVAIFEAIGFDFLRRLLLTDDVPVDCPPTVYKSLALSILTVFCAEERLATKQEMLDLIPVFLSIVKSADDSENDDNLMAIGEAYNCLKGIALYAPGQKTLIDARAIDILGDIYASASFQSDEALNIMGLLVAKKGALSWDPKDPKAFHALVNKIALDFETDQDKRKFELAEWLNAIIFNCPRKVVGESAASETWPQSIYKGLTDVLQSKVGPAQRNPALILASSMVDLLGIEWIFNNDEVKGKQIFLLLIQLAAIEVRMQLDGKSLKSTGGHQNLTTACYVILELALNFMAQDTVDLDQKERQSVYAALKGAFHAVINLLLKVAQDKNEPRGEDKLFVCATIRVLSAWLAQETTAMREQVYQLLPFVLQTAFDSFRAYKANRIARKSGDADDDPTSRTDLLRVLLPALCHLAVEEESRATMLKAGGDAVLMEALDFYWTDVNYKRPPVPRSERLKALGEPKPELAPEILEDINDARLAMISICNVLMNLTVLEGRHVESSPVFNDLLRFIFDTLPELKDVPENLVLHGNLAVLGLLLLKQLSAKVKKNDFSICRFVQCTIRFLWNAYTVDESSDPTELVVAMNYKEQWTEMTELWFLGMQTFAGILSQIPWIGDFVVESGWAEGVVRLLGRVKIGTLSPNVKCAFEDLLCHLVDADEGVADVLKKAEALRVCRNHRLMELGKKLFGD